MENTESNLVFETNCAPTEMNPWFTHPSPTSTFGTGYKSDENQLRYSETNITATRICYQ
jgi:hypothetical protein